MRLIDADALADALFEKRKNYPQWVADTIGKMPNAVVRCKDCKYWYNGCCYSRVSNRINFTVEVPDDWFCADGEQKEQK